MGESESVSREELIELFRKAQEMGWSVTDAAGRSVFHDFPKGGVQNFWPAKANIFRALEQIGPKDVKYLMLGQDPYPNVDEIGMPYATGVAFSIPRECRQPADSFKNLIQQLGSSTSDLEYAVDCYERWIKVNSILMLNSALTVEQGNAGSHLRHWNSFIIGVIQQVRKASRDANFIAFGDPAGKLMKRGLGGVREFIWTCHPQPRNGENTFKKFWESSLIGQDLRNRFQAAQQRIDR